MLSKKEKLKMLDILLLDKYIEAMGDGTLKPLELGAVVSYLKMNAIQEDKDTGEGQHAKVKRLVKR